MASCLQSMLPQHVENETNGTEQKIEIFPFLELMWWPLSKCVDLRPPTMWIWGWILWFLWTPNGRSFPGPWPLRPVWECLNTKSPNSLLFVYNYLHHNEHATAVPQHFSNCHSPISFDWSIPHCHPASPWMWATHLPLWHLLGHPLSRSRIISHHIHKATIDRAIKSTESSSDWDKKRTGRQENNIHHFSQGFCFNLY